MTADTKTKKKKKYRVTHNHELCKSCGLCMEFCPVGGIEADILGKAMFLEDKRGNCLGCMRCVWMCPDFANWIEEIDDEDDDKQTSEDEEKKSED